MLEQEEITGELVEINSGRDVSKRKISLWRLVLEARSIPCRMEFDENRWRLFTSADFFDTAIKELRQFEENNRDWPPPPPPPRQLSENTLATLSVLLMLAIFHNLTILDIALPYHIPIDWKEAGSARGELITDGQWWRAVTALTLHADGLHLVSNIAIGSLFILPLCRELGSGTAWTLLLCSGALGNIVNALVQPSSHNSVGASTLVFGAVGILAAINLLRYRHQLQKRWPLPLAAALALLALLGTEGKNTDIGAHLFGFASGVVLGFIAEYLMERHGRPDEALSALMSLVCAAAVVAAWWLAIS